MAVDQLRHVGLHGLQRAEAKLWTDIQGRAEEVDLPSTVEEGSPLILGRVHA